MKRYQTGCLRNALWRQFTVFAKVVELPSVAPLSIHIKRHTGIDRARIDVDAHRRFAILATIEQLVNRLKLVGCEDRSVSRRYSFGQAVEFDVIRAGEAVETDYILILRVIAAKPLVFHNLQDAALHYHPAQLAVVSVDGRLLTRLPADRHHLEEIVPVDQIARIKGVVIDDVW